MMIDQFGRVVPDNVAFNPTATYADAGIPYNPNSSQAFLTGTTPNAVDVTPSTGSGGNPFVTAAMLAADPNRYKGTSWDPSLYVGANNAPGTRLANNPGTPDAPGQSTFAGSKPFQLPTSAADTVGDYLQGRSVSGTWTPEMIQDFVARVGSAMNQYNMPVAGRAMNSALRFAPGSSSYVASKPFNAATYESDLAAYKNAVANAFGGSPLAAAPAATAPIAAAAPAAAATTPSQMEQLATLLSSFGLTQQPAQQETQPSPVRVRPQRTGGPQRYGASMYGGDAPYGMMQISNPLFSAMTPPGGTYASGPSGGNQGTDFAELLSTILGGGTGGGGGGNMFGGYGGTFSGPSSNISDFGPGQVGLPGFQSAPSPQYASYYAGLQQQQPAPANPFASSPSAYASPATAGGSLAWTNPLAAWNTNSGGFWGGMQGNRNTQQGSGFQGGFFG